MFLQRQRHTMLDYELHGYPHVEVQIDVRECGGYNLAGETINLDCVLTLDWLDFQLLEVRLIFHVYFLREFPNTAQFWFYVLVLLCCKELH